jgi:hypothetical protein
LGTSAVDTRGACSSSCAAAQIDWFVGSRSGSDFLFFTKFTITAFMVFSHPIPNGLASVGSCAFVLIFLLSVVGWAALAFNHPSKK